MRAPTRIPDAEFFRPVPGFHRYRIGRNRRVWFNRTEPGLPPPWDVPEWVPVRRRSCGGVPAVRLKSERREYTRSLNVLLEAAFSDDPAGWIDRVGPSAPERPYYGASWDASDLEYDADGDPILPLSASRGVRNGRAKLTEFDVLEIRRLSAGGLNLPAIMRRFRGKASKGTVHAIIAGRTWRHVGLPPAPSAGVRRRRPASRQRLAALAARARDAAYALHVRAERCSSPRRRAALVARAEVLAARLVRFDGAAAAADAGKRARSAPAGGQLWAPGEQPS